MVKKTENDMLKKNILMSMVIIILMYNISITFASHHTSLPINTYYSSQYIDKVKSKVASIDMDTMVATIRSNKSKKYPEIINYYIYSSLLLASEGFQNEVVLDTNTNYDSDKPSYFEYFLNQQKENHAFENLDYSRIDFLVENKVKIFVGSTDLTFSLPDSIVQYKVIDNKSHEITYFLNYN